MSAASPRNFRYGPSDTAVPDWAGVTARAWEAPSWKEAAAPQSTVEALMMGLRERGIAALTEPKVRRRLSECDEQQVAEVGNRLQKLKPGILRLGKGKLHRGWTPEEVEILLQTWGALR